MKDYLLSEIVAMCKKTECDKCELLVHCNHNWSVSPDQWEVEPMSLLEESRKISLRMKEIVDKIGAYHEHN